MEMITRHLTGIPAQDLAFLGGEGVPDRRAAAIFLSPAFDLVRGRRRPPYETLRETEYLFVGHNHLIR